MFGSGIQEVVSPGTGSPHRFVALDSLRGVCACIVAIYHFHSDGIIGRNALVQNAQLFVDFFFVLSGFVIASSYSAKLTSGYSLKNFMYLRLGRLYPLHIFILLLFLLVWIVERTLGGGGDGKTFNGFLASAAFLQIFVQGGVGAWNSPSWSIAAEFWTYLIFALAWKFMGRSIFALIALFLLLCPFLLVHVTDRNLNVCFEGALLRAMFGFGFGVLGYRALDSGIYKLALEKPTFLIKTMIEVLAATAIALFIPFAGASIFSFLCPPLFLGAVLVFSSRPGMIGRILEARIAVFVGSLSYSIYLVHMFVQSRILNALGFASRYGDLPVLRGEFGVVTAPGWDGAADVAVIAMLSIVIAVAYLTYRFVEVPGRQWSRGLVARRRR